VIDETGQDGGLVVLFPNTLNPTLFAAEIFAGHVKVDDSENKKGWFPDSGFGQYVNFVVPSKAVVVVAEVGDAQLKVGDKGGLEPALTLI
jgi:hypothetical protein